VYVIIAGIAVGAWWMLRPKKFNATAYHVSGADYMTLGILGLVVGFFALLFLSWFTDWDDWIRGELDTPTALEQTCAKERLEELEFINSTIVPSLREIRNGDSMVPRRIPSEGAGVRFTLCPGDGRIQWLYVEEGGRLEISFSGRFATQNPDIVENHNVLEFLFAQRGPIPDSYYLHVPATTRDFTSPFDLGIEDVEIVIRTVHP
jgi:hypothetical protein